MRRIKSRKTCFDSRGAEVLRLKLSSMGDKSMALYCKKWEFLEVKVSTTITPPIGSSHNLLVSTYLQSKKYVQSQGNCRNTEQSH
jgi:hypothetical protein